MRKPQENGCRLPLRAACLILCVSAIGCGNRQTDPSEDLFRRPWSYGSEQKIRMLFVGIMNGKANLSDLTERERYVWDVTALEVEFMNGGTDQVFYNSTGDRIQSTLIALKAIGATRTANALRKAANLFSGGKPSTDAEVRQKQMEKIRHPNDEILNQVGEDMFQEDVFGLLLDYWKRHEPLLELEPASTKPKKEILRLFVDLPIKEEQDYEKLSERERFVWDICFFEALSGGKGNLYGSFMGPEITHAPAVAHALDKIGASHTSAIVKKILSFYPGGRPSSDILERLQQTLSVTIATKKAFAEVEVSNGVVKHEGWEENLYVLLLKYWKQHEKQR